MATKPTRRPSSTSTAAKSRRSTSKASKSPAKPAAARSRVERGAEPGRKADSPQVVVEPVGDSKQARLIAQLRTAQGATIAQMTALTGWQPHSVRGAISGVLRKKLGLNVTCSTPDASGARVYRIADKA